MEMKYIQTPSASSAQAGSAAAQGAASTAVIDGDAQHSFNQTLIKVIGGTEAEGQSADIGKALAGGMIPASVLLAIVPQTDAEEAAAPEQRLAEVLRAADGEELAPLLQHPLLLDWLNQLMRFQEASGQSTGQAAFGPELAAVKQLLASLTSAAADTEAAGNANLLRTVLMSVQQMLHTDSANPAVQPLAAGFKAITSELAAGLTVVPVAERSQQEEASGAIARAVEHFAGKTGHANLLAAAANQTGGQLSDQPHGQQRLLERLSFMKPIVHVIALHDGEAAPDGLPKSDAPASLQAAGVTVQESAQTATAVADPLRASASAEVKVPTAVVQAGQFATEMSRFMVKNMTLTQNGALSEARITLIPEHLGQLDVKIAVHNGQLTATFVAESAGARDMLENQLPMLRAALQQQGLQVEKLVVSHQQSLGSGLFQEGRGQQSAKQQSDNGGRSDRSFDAGQDFLLEIEEAFHSDGMKRYGSTFHASA